VPFGVKQIFRFVAGSDSIGKGGFLAALLIARVEMTFRRFVVPSLQPQGQLQRHRASRKLGFENL
jgi:hypothetical protein